MLSNLNVIHRLPSEKKMNKQLISSYKKIYFLNATLFLTLLVLPNSALGETFRLIDGQRRDIDSVVDTDQALFYATKGLSYCCRIWSTTAFDDELTFDFVLSGDSSVEVSNRGYATPNTAGRQFDGELSNRCFITSASDFTEVVLRMESGGAGVGTTENVSMICEETSLYGSFNTVATDYNFIEITNTLVSNSKDNGAVEFTVIANGVIANGEILNREFTVAAGRRVDIDIHSRAQNDFGTVKITHNGPKGALRATLVQYKIDNAATGEFTPVLRVPFETRTSN